MATRYKAQIIIQGIFITMMSILTIHTAQAAKPIVNNPIVEKSSIAPGQTMNMRVTAADLDEKPLIYTWSASLGEIIGEGSHVIYKSPNTIPSNTINTVTVLVSNGDEAVEKTTTFTINKPTKFAQIVLTTPDTELTLGEQSEIQLTLNPQGHTIQSTTFDITYDPLVIELIDTNTNIAGVQVEIDESQGKTTVNQAIKKEGDPLHHIQATITFPRSLKDNATLITIPFQAKGTTNQTYFTVAKASLIDQNETGDSIKYESNNIQLKIQAEGTLQALKPSASEDPATQQELPTPQEESIHTDIKTPQETQPKSQLHGAANELIMTDVNKKDLSETGPTTNAIFLITITSIATLMMRRLILKVRKN